MNCVLSQQPSSSSLQTLGLSQSTSIPADLDHSGSPNVLDDTTKFLIAVVAVVASLLVLAAIATFFVWRRWRRLRDKYAMDDLKGSRHDSTSDADNANAVSTGPSEGHVDNINQFQAVPFPLTERPLETLSPPQYQYC